MSADKRIVKIGQHVAKLQTKIEWFHFFPDTVYMYCVTSSSPWRRVSIAIAVKSAT